MSETDTGPSSHEPTSYDSDPPQLPPRSSSWSSSRSLTHKTKHKPRQTEKCTSPIQNKSQNGGLSPSLRPLKKRQPSDPLNVPSDSGERTSSLPNVPGVEATCTPESECTSPELFPGRNETDESKHYPPKHEHELRVDPSLQFLQEQIQSLQKQMSSVMEKQKDDQSSTATKNNQEPTDSTPGKRQG